MCKEWTRTTVGPKKLGHWLQPWKAVKTSENVQEIEHSEWIMLLDII